jgi:PhzF family phenazine biosynthesis protein
MIPYSIVDAFTDTPFAGNPAAVCVLEKWPSDEWLQLVAREMNLSETAFLVPKGAGKFELRWCTPRVEVALCGHATLAAAHFLWESGREPPTSLTFVTRKSGTLTATAVRGGDIALDFPAQPAIPATPPALMLADPEIWSNEIG